MKQELMDAIQEMPVIAAVKDDTGLCNALTNENIRVVFVLYGDICNIATIVRRIHEAGRFAVVHVDLIAGLAGKEVAVDFIRSTTEADGIISTRQSFIRRAKELGLAAILRVFLLDSIALESLDKIPANLPDCLDLLPGTMPKILRRVCATAKVPVLTGGQRGRAGRTGSRGHCHFHHQSGRVGYVSTGILHSAQKRQAFFVRVSQKAQNTLLFAQGQGIIRANKCCLFQEI